MADVNKVALTVLVAGQMLSAAAAALFFVFDSEGVVQRTTGRDFDSRLLALGALALFVAFAGVNQWRLWNSNQHRRATKRAIAALTPLAVQGSSFVTGISIYFPEESETADQRARDKARDQRLADWNRQVLSIIESLCPEFTADWLTAKSGKHGPRVQAIIEELRRRL